jgi:hypothetical protein
MRCHSTKYFLLQNRRHVWRRIKGRREEKGQQEKHKEIGISKTTFPYPLKSDTLYKGPTSALTIVLHVMRCK